MKRVIPAIVVLAASGLAAVPSATAYAASSESSSAIQLTPSVQAATTLARQYLTDRADRLVIQSGPRHSALTAVPLASGLAAETASALVALDAERGYLQAAGEEYIKADVQVSNPKLTRAKGGTFDLHVLEDTKLYYKPVPGAPPYMEWVEGRTFNLLNIDGKLELTAQKADDAANGAPPLPTDVTAPRAIAAGSLAANGLTPAPQVTAARLTNGLGASNWALANWSNDGGWWRMPDDCTNFVSLALWQGGGWPMVYVSSNRTNPANWWMHPPVGKAGEDWSNAWTVANTWHTFATNSGRATTIGTSVDDTGSIRSLYNGDIVQEHYGTYSIIHTMMVTQVDVYGERYMTYHSNDNKNRSFYSIVVSQTGVLYYFMRLN